MTLHSSRRAPSRSRFFALLAILGLASDSFASPFLLPENLSSELLHLDAKKDHYIQRGVELIELVHDLENIYKSSSAQKKRRIIEVVSSNHKLRDGKICFDYRKPFDLLAGSHPKEKWWT